MRWYDRLRSLNDLITAKWSGKFGTNEALDCCKASSPPKEIHFFDMRRSIRCYYASTALGLDSSARYHGIVLGILRGEEARNVLRTSILSCGICTLHDWYWC